MKILFHFYRIQVIYFNNGCHCSDTIIRFTIHCTLMENNNVVITIPIFALSKKSIIIISNTSES